MLVITCGSVFRKSRARLQREHLTSTCQDIHTMVRGRRPSSLTIGLALVVLAYAAE